MTVRAIFGLVILNLGFLLVGASILWGVRGWRWWTDLLRLAGLAYFLGIAAMVIALSLEVVLGISFGMMSALGTAAAISCCSAALGIHRELARPRWSPPEWRIPTPSLFVAVMVACVGLWLEASFRAARLQPIRVFDAWWVWTSRAKELFFTGDLGGEIVLRGGNSQLMSYPPGLSLLQAQAFEAMGSADTVTIHLQNWFFALGFLASVFGLLARRVRGPILVPVALLTIVMPKFSDIAIWPIADPLLAYMVAIGALLVCLWLEDGAPWRITSAPLLLGAAVLVKREAALIVLCVLFASFVASWSRRRCAWPTIAVAAFATFALSASWRIWLVVRGVSEAPTDGYLAFLHVPGRAIESAGLVASTFVGARWGLPMMLAFAAIGLALAAGARIAPSFVAAFVAASFIIITYVIWSEPFFAISQELPLNPVVRMVMGSVVVICPLTAIMLQDAWSHGHPPDSLAAPRPAPRPSRLRNVVAWSIIGIALLLYPASAITGLSGPTLPGGPPSFPGRESQRTGATDADTESLTVGKRPRHRLSQPAASLGALPKRHPRPSLVADDAIVIRLVEAAT